jgi:flagellar basal body-associated protein FliL
MLDPMGGPGGPLPVIEEPPPAKQSFFASRTGKIVLAAVAVVIVLGAAAVAALMFLGFFSSDVSVQPLPGKGGAANETTSTPPVNRPEPAYTDTFAFRNVFKPTVNPPAEATAEEIDPSEMPTDTLVLTALSTVDGEPVATLYWNGTTYEVREGETVGSTPWKVITIGDDWVKVLYGDVVETLALGTGITK